MTPFCHTWHILLNKMYISSYNLLSINSILLLWLSNFSRQQFEYSANREFRPGANDLFVSAKTTRPNIVTDYKFVPDVLIVSFFLSSQKAKFRTKMKRTCLDSPSMIIIRHPRSQTRVCSLRCRKLPYQDTRETVINRISHSADRLEF